jgi:hypothetical protein
VDEPIHVVALVQVDDVLDRRLTPAELTAAL